MTKLLIIAPQNPYPAKDGGKIGIYYPVIHLTKYFQIHFAFITPHEVTSDVYDHFKKHNISIYPQLINTKDSVFGYLLNITSSLPYKFQKYCSPTILKRLDAICKKEEINNIWCNHSHVAWYGLELKKRRGATIFLREHNIEYSLVHQVMKVQMNPLLKTFVRYQYLKTKKFEIQCWNSFEKTFFISDSDLALATKNLNEEKCVLLYDSFSEKKETADKSNETVNVLKEPYSFIFTASIETFQNLYNLQKFISEIWQPLIAKDNRWKLYITGNRQEVLEKKLKLDLNRNNIKNLGFVDNIQRAIASTKYFISPTYIGSGLRIKVLNAIAQGAVSFVTPIDLKMIKIFKDGFNIIKFDDFEDFYSKLLRLEEDNALYEQISVQAVQVGSTFSWSKYVDIVYNEVAQVESFTGR